MEDAEAVLVPLRSEEDVEVVEEHGGDDGGAWRSRFTFGIHGGWWLADCGGCWGVVDSRRSNSAPPMGVVEPLRGVAGGVEPVAVAVMDSLVEAVARTDRQAG